MIDFKKMFSLMERIDHQYAQYKKILNEGVETKNMSAAKHYLYDKMGYDEQQAMKVIGSIKHDIPNSRLAKCKFMFGLVRMFCNGEINNGEFMTKLNQTLEYAASDKYINNFNQDLNGLTCSELISQFEGIISQDIALRKDKMSQEQYIANNLYNIVKIDSFEEANKYSAYCDWCITQDSDAFDNYGGNLLTQFYFCLKKGFENEEAIIGDDCPLDSYGLSMIAVSIRPDGSINTCTCRWNHDNGGNDNIMNDEQLSKLLGVNIYDVLKPKEKIDIIPLIEDGSTSLESIAVGDFIIPDGVKCIGDWVFSNCKGLTSITIPNGVTSIGDGAFQCCYSLTSITIPDSVTSIGGAAFGGCSGLTSVTIPNSVTSIGYYAFSGCKGLTSVTIPDSVTSIGDGAFYVCSGLTSVTIGSGVISIGNSVFQECEGLTSIDIPYSVTSIGKIAFSGCKGLTSVTIPDSVTSIGDGAFLNCSGLTSITIPDSVTSIGRQAFIYCSSLTNITIPSSVISIGNSAFFCCHRLTVYVQSEQTASLVTQSGFRGNIQYVR